MKCKLFGGASVLAAVAASAPGVWASPEGGGMEAGACSLAAREAASVGVVDAGGRAEHPLMLPVMDYDPMSIAMWYEHGPASLCFDKDSPPPDEVIAELHRVVYGSLLRYYQVNRWGTTANTPLALTWSFIPDGTSIPAAYPPGEATSGSNLFSAMDAKFGGNRALWIAQVQACFDRWAALTGTSYTRVTFGGNPWDDGAAFPSSSASAGVRGDVRIGGHSIGGAGGILAYNYYPANGGDMVLDTTDGWGNSTGSYVALRNTVLHEHGHGLGLLHVCPSNNTKLMEPFLNTGFDGPQHDDLRGVMNYYGDAYEPNASAATATVLGTLAANGALTPSSEPAPTITNGSLTSIGADGDMDWYRVNASVAMPISVTVTPRGLSYDNSTQNSNGSCNSGSTFNSLAVAPLSVEVRASDGTTVLGANSAAAGVTAQLSNINVAAGNFYVRVYESGAPTQSQLYDVVIASGPAAPVNNACASAPYIWFGTLTGTNVSATADGADTCRGGANEDVWYQIVPSCTGTLILDTCGSPLDTVLSVHTGCPGSTGNQVGCNDDNGGAGPCPGGLTSYLSVPVTAGTNYKIRVAGYNGSNGIFTLNVGFYQAINDDCADAAAVTPGTLYGGPTCGATNDGTASCGASQGSPDVWFAYTPTCDVQMSFTTCGANYDTVLTVFSGACGSLTEVACNDDAAIGTACGETLQSAVTVSMIAGTPYLIRVAGFGGAVGNYRLDVGLPTQPNDLCSNAQVIARGDYTGSTCSSGREVNDTCRASSTSGDVWYQWVAPCTGTLAIDTCGSSYDTVVSVHTGLCGSLTQIACNDDAGPFGRCAYTTASYLSVPVTAGIPYLIRVSGFNGQSGRFNLRVTEPPNDYCSDAPAIGLGTTAYDTTCATADGNATCGDTGAAADVWYVHTATCTGPLWVDTCGSAYDNVMTAFTGACGSLTEIVCNDDQLSRCAVNTRHAFIAFRASVGSTYILRASGYSGAVGTGVINIRCCLADYNLSGVVSVQDIFDFLSGYFSNNPYADVNNSGAVSVQDIFDYLAAYFAGCA